MKKTHDFLPLSERDDFDSGPCSYQNGFAQIDTKQYASYYCAIWCSPAERKIVTFSEGDLTVAECESDEELVAELRGMAAWNDERGCGPMRIDACGNRALAAHFERLGVGDLLH